MFRIIILNAQHKQFTSILSVNRGTCLQMRYKTQNKYPF